MADKKAILVIGAGDATGGAIAKRFAKEGYIAYVTRRTVTSWALMSRNAMGALRVSKLPTQIPFLSRDVELFPGVPKTGAWAS